MPGSSDVIGTTVSLGREHVESIMPLLKFDANILSLQVITVWICQNSTFYMNI
jgi:hypothetical protein